MLVKQGKWSLNMLRPSRINPKISTATWLEGQHSYNAVPFVPPGWEILCFEDPDDRGSWSPHGVRGFNIAPCLKHYHCNEVLILATHIMRVRNTVVFFPSPNYTLPSTPTEEESVHQAARKLGQTLRDMAMNNPTYQELGQHSGLQQLGGIIEAGT